MKTLFLMSPPKRDWQLKGKANFRSQSAANVNAEHARLEWTTLANAICDAGGEVLVCPPAPTQALTGMIYTAEAGELTRDARGNLLFLLPNMASPHRREEAAWMDSFFRHLNIPTSRVQAVWEAQGDAIRVGGNDMIIHTYGEGPYARTQADAYKEVAARLSPRHIQLRFRADPWFHGNTFLNIYHNDNKQLVVVCPDALDTDQMDHLLEALSDAQIHQITKEESEGYDTNALQVGETVLASATLSETSRVRMEQLGLRVEQIALDELFLKGGGAPVCLTNRLWGITPQEASMLSLHLWSAHPEIAHHEALALYIQPG